MEKNMVVVYENGVGVPFLLKPFGNQVMLLSPGIELSRLRLDNINWDLDAVGDTKGGESEFRYLCMTGEEISANRMFALLMLTQKCGGENSTKDAVETLCHWGVSCTYEPVNMEIHIYKRDRDGRREYCFMGEGFMDIAMSTPICLADNIGYSLLNILKTNLFLEINIEIDHTGFESNDFYVFKQELFGVMGNEENIHITFKDKEY